MGDNKKVANSVVALSSAAVLAIYGAGYSRTRAAADRFAQQAAERRPHIPAPRGDGDAAPPEARASASPVPTVVAADEVGPPDPASAAPLTVSRASVESVTSQAPAIAAKATPAETPVTPAPVAAVPKSAPPKPETTTASTIADAAPPLTEDEGAPAQSPSVAAAQTPAPAPTPVPAPAPAPAAPAPAAKAGYKDGTYYGWGTSRHGDIQAAVTIEEGKITVARVERCLTRYSCNWITPIPPRILLKQGTTYDYVSGATESSDAFQDAVAEALFQAK